ncbi:MAG: site-2 protease family protein [Tepidisphaera sp.]
MQGWWVIDTLNQSPALLATWIFWIIFSICLHELGHGWAAIWQGDRTPIDAGHMTWNPFVHMGPMSLLLFALFGFAWGAMPVNPSRFRSRYGDALVAAAGPLMNVILGVFCLAGVAILFRVVSSGAVDVSKTFNLFMFFHTGLSLNIFLVMFNLFPVPPLDGSRILGNFVPGFYRLFNGEKGQFVMVFGFAVLYMFASRPMQRAAWQTSDALVQFVM